MLREATLDDIPQMHRVRLSVKENALSNPELIKENDYREYLVNRGNGWVYENDNVIVGFAIVDLSDHNVWALFVQPGNERGGIGRQLHTVMLDGYFEKTITSIWLSTALGTRAEHFYRNAGWKQNGFQPNGEVRLEMSLEGWNKIANK
jgi:N-acetylglutamate synthase-like GNAT family acetyltransferase